MRFAVAGRRRGRGAPGRQVFVLAAAGVLLLVAGCHPPGTSSAGSPSASATVTVDAAPGVADAPLFAGIKDGLFRSAGLTVHVRDVSSVTAELEQLRSGQATIAFADYPDMFFAQEQNNSSDLSIVSDGYDCSSGVMEVLALPNSGLVGAASLANKRIGTAEPGTIPFTAGRPFSLETLATWSALSDSHGQPATIHWQPMPASRLISALNLGQVDAIVATEPVINQAEQKLGAVSVLDACSGATTNLPLDGYFASRGYAVHHQNVIAAFRSALARAQADGSMATQVQAVLKSDAKMPARTAALVTLGTYPTSLVPASVQRVADLMFANNVLGSPLTVSSMVAPGGGGQG